MVDTGFMSLLVCPESGGDCKDLPANLTKADYVILSNIPKHHELLSSNVVIVSCEEKQAQGMFYDIMDICKSCTQTSENNIAIIGK